MPWRLIIAIVVFAILLVFVTFNLDNRCDINFGFIPIHNVPVFITVFFSFTVGLFCAFPLAIFMGRKRHGTAVSGKDKKKQKIFAAPEDEGGTTDGSQDAAD